MSTNSDFMLGFSSAIFATPDAIRTAVYKAASDLGSTAEVRSDGTNLAVIVTTDNTASTGERTAVALASHSEKNSNVVSPEIDNERDHGGSSGNVIPSR